MVIPRFRPLTAINSGMFHCRRFLCRMDLEPFRSGVFLFPAIMASVAFRKKIGTSKKNDALKFAACGRKPYPMPGARAGRGNVLHKVGRA